MQARKGTRGLVCTEWYEYSKEQYITVQAPEINRSQSRGGADEAFGGSRKSQWKNSSPLSKLGASVSSTIDAGMQGVQVKYVQVDSVLMKRTKTSDDATKQAL